MAIPGPEILLKIKRRYDCTLDYLLDCDVTTPNPISENEARLLRMIRILGADRAEMRLLGVPEPHREPEITLSPKTPAIRLKRKPSAGESKTG